MLNDTLLMQHVMYGLDRMNCICITVTKPSMQPCYMLHGAGFVALLREAGDKERAARQEACFWQAQAAQWKEK